MKTAVLIFGWNRPCYMQKMLQSVSKNIKLDTYVYLDYQKNVNITKELILLCEKYIPHAKITCRPRLFGCQNNIDYARVQIFNKGYDRIIVLQDDFIISQHYFELLTNALDWCQQHCPKIVMVIGWTGQNYKDYSIDKYNPYSLSFSILHMLGYILSKKGWDDLFPYYQKYIALTKDKNVDLAGVDLWGKINNLLRSYPVNLNFSEAFKKDFKKTGCAGQDRATISCLFASGNLRANFDISRLQYIGKIGLHSIQKDFNNFFWKNVSKYENENDKTNKQFQLDPILNSYCK